MTELYDAAFAAVNLPYTILLITMTGYWLIAILGLIDIGGFDLDVDLDADVDFDVAGDISGFQSIFAFFNFGEVPVMFYLSIVALSMWLLSVQLNYFLQDYLGAYQVWFAVALAIPNLIFGLFMAKIAVMPFKWANDHRQQEIPLVGKMCLVTSLEITEKSGQCELQTDAAPLTLNACTTGGEVLKKGDAAVVVERDKKNNIYTVTKYHPES